MKRIAASVLAVAVCAALSVPVFAAPVDQNSTEQPGTEFTFVYKNDPTYTVTIPEAVTIEKTGTRMEIKAEDVAYLDNQKVSVTIAGTSAFRDQMVLEGKTESGSLASIRYRFLMDDGRVIETTPDNQNGTELAAFTEDGTVSFGIEPVLTGSSSIKKGVTYTGSMTYAIQLVSLS